MPMAIKNRFDGVIADYAAPPSDFEAVTPHDSTDFSQVCRAIYVGAAGNVAAVTVSNVVAQHNGVAAGTYIIGFFRRVNATGTTATNMLAVG